MSNFIVPRKARGLTLAAAGSLVLIASASFAAAQDYDRHPDQSGYYQSGPPEQVIVTAPHYRHPYHKRSAIGAPVFNEALTQEVRYDDLDLRSYCGAHEFKVRIDYAVASRCSHFEDEHDLIDID